VRSVHVFRAAAGLATRPGHRTPHRPGLCLRHAGADGRVFPRGHRAQCGLNNLNTHSPAALYATFPPAEACPIVRKLDFHYAPKHSRSLKQAAIELTVVSTHGMDRRLGDHEVVHRALAA
jgi:hypothetical protein